MGAIRRQALVYRDPHRQRARAMRTIHMQPDLVSIAEFADFLKGIIGADSRLACIGHNCHGTFAFRSYVLQRAVEFLRDDSSILVDLQAVNPLLSNS